MADMINLERKGIPAVALVHDRFETVARNQARIFGLASAKIVSIIEPGPDEVLEHSQDRIDQVWDTLVGSLTSD